jgi:thiosulfate dehydrogenase [quinone] large subunit
MSTHGVSWRLRGMGILRIVFGLVWAIDASFKWQPGFAHNFTHYLTGNLAVDPGFVQAWINLWITIVKGDPQVFAYLVASAETAIAIGLIFGIFSHLTEVVGVLLALVIWTTAQGFGGPYLPGSTDIGAALIYVLVFVALFLSSAGLYYGVDRSLSPTLRRFSFLAEGRCGVSQ